MSNQRQINVVDNIRKHWNNAAIFKVEKRRNNVVKMTIFKRNKKTLWGDGDGAEVIGNFAWKVYV